jgi:hypothetical protein
VDAWRSSVLDPGIQLGGWLAGCFDSLASARPAHYYESTSYTCIEPTTSASCMPVHPFIQRWQTSAAAERANYQLFLSELCDYLDVPRPDPAVSDDGENRYVFERPVTFRHASGSTSVGFIDLYKRGCFVLEAKQGSVAPEPTLPV